MELTSAGRIHNEVFPHADVVHLLFGQRENS